MPTRAPPVRLRLSATDARIYDPDVTPRSPKPFRVHYFFGPFEPDFFFFFSSPRLSRPTLVTITRTRTLQ